MEAYVREAYRAHLEALGYVAYGSDRLDDSYCIMAHTDSAVAFVIGPEGISQVPVERETD